MVVQITPTSEILGTFEEQAESLSAENIGAIVVQPSGRTGIIPGQAERIITTTLVEQEPSPVKKKVQPTFRGEEQKLPTFQVTSEIFRKTATTGDVFAKLRDSKVTTEPQFEPQTFVQPTRGEFVETTLPVTKGFEQARLSGLERGLLEIEFAGTGEISPGVKAPTTTATGLLAGFGRIESTTGRALETFAESPLSTPTPFIKGIFQKTSPIDTLGKKISGGLTPVARADVEKIGSIPFPIVGATTFFSKQVSPTTKDVGMLGLDIIEGARQEFKARPITTTALFAGGFFARPIISGGRLLLAKGAMTTVRSTPLLSGLLRGGRILGKSLNLGVTGAFIGGAAINIGLSPEPIGKSIGRESLRIGSVVGGFKVAGKIKKIRGLEIRSLTDIKNIGRAETTVFQKGRGVSVDIARSKQIARVLSGGKLKRFVLKTEAHGITRPDIDKTLLRSDVSKVKVFRTGVRRKDLNKVLESFTAEVKGVTRIVPKKFVTTGKGEFGVLTKKGVEAFAREGTIDFTGVRGKKGISRIFTTVKTTPFKKVRPSTTKDILRRLAVEQRIAPPKIRIKEDPTLRKGLLGRASPFESPFSKQPEISLRKFLSPKQKLAVIRHELTHIADIRKGLDIGRIKDKPMKIPGELSKKDLGVVKDFQKLFGKERHEEFLDITSFVATKYPKSRFSGEIRARLVEKFPEEVLRPTTPTGRSIRKSFLSLQKEFAVKTKRVSHSIQFEELGVPTGKIRGLQPFTKTLTVSKQLARIRAPIEIRTGISGVTLETPTPITTTIFTARNIGLSTRTFDKALRKAIVKPRRGKIPSDRLPPRDVVKKMIASKRAERIGGSERLRTVTELRLGRQFTTQESLLKISTRDVAKLVLEPTTTITTPKTLFRTGVASVTIPGTISEIRQSLRSLTKTKELTATKSLTSLKAITSVKEIAGVKEIAAVKSVTSLKSLTSLRSISSLKSVTSLKSLTSLTSIPVIIDVPPPPPVIIPHSFDLRKGRDKKKARKFALPTRETLFQPSLVATALKIKGKEPKRLTGLEVRPIRL